jgi:prepilin-type N-terminal cleavage/methylation domain-containing protein
MGKLIYNYKQLSQKKKAFTLIELLIVIAIIGILFIVLVSKVDFATDKAKASGVQTTFRSFQVAFETVSKENAGFNTFGWDIGDNGAGIANGDILTLNGKDYTYTNAAKDAGDRIRNSYDVGDTNLNGKYDDGEIWTGRKVYTETWTGCYTLINPGNASDMSAIFDLETAINKNLDPKLHINIADDGTIYMANGYKDPWNTQYHGRYITNACTEAAAKWNTDASMNGSIGDNMDRGAIVMYSNGANQRLGTKVKIKGGIVTATVSQIDADHPDNNKMGADDYVLAVVYTYTNGLGSTSTITEGFSNNQQYLTGNGGNVGGIAYTIIDGANETFVKNSTTLSFRSNADYDKFVEVKIDNNVIDPSNYTVTEGSTIVTFTKEYFNSLGEGKHTVEIVSNDGIADASFAIQKP